MADDYTGAAIRACHMVRGATIKGLAIKGGNANGLEQNALGAGVLCPYCTNLEIDHCDLTGNTAVGGESG